jgi:heme/copper-type cytochrome/quinol oxidase subunit 3
MTTPSGPTRSMVARGAGGAASVAARRRALPNGIWGMLLFLCSEITIFGTLLATYFYLDFDARRWPPAGIKPPEVLHPSLATGWLLLTVIPMWLASRTARRGERSLTLAAIAVGFLMQCGYVAAQVILFRHDLLQFSPKATAYGSIYFTLLGTHHAHVILGLFLDVGLLWFVATRGLTNYWLIGVRGLALFWYVVAGLAVPVVLTQLTPSL